MTEYLKVQVNLTDSQIGKLKHALNANTSVKFRLKRSQVGKGLIHLPLTPSQHQKLMKGNADVTLSKTALDYGRKHGGSFFGSLFNKVIKPIGKTVVDIAKNKDVQKFGLDIAKQILAKRLGGGAGQRRRRTVIVS